MAAEQLTDRYAANLHGVLSCYDRIIITGTLPGAGYAGGMTSFQYAHGIRIFDYPRFAEPLRDRIRQRAQEVCEANGVSIEHVNKSHIRKEDLVARVLAVRGGAPGLVLVISAMESCSSYKPWLNNLMFRSRDILSPLYDTLSRQAVLAADAPRAAGFLGKRITPQLAQEIGSRLSTRIEGRCIKHHMGAASVKVYDKFSRVLRVGTTVNNVSFFKHHRKVEHKDAAATRELAPLKKSIYSLIDLRGILLSSNQRYLAFLSSLDDTSAGERDLQRLSLPRVGTEPSVRAAIAAACSLTRFNIVPALAAAR